MYVEESIFKALFVEVDREDVKNHVGWTAQLPNPDPLVSWSRLIKAIGNLVGKAGCAGPLQDSLRYGRISTFDDASGQRRDHRAGKYCEVLEVMETFAIRLNQNSAC